MTVDPLGMDTGAPLTVTSMSLLAAAAGCCDAEQLVWNVLSAAANVPTGASRQARRLCAASDRRLNTIADLACAMMPFMCPWMIRWNHSKLDICSVPRRRHVAMEC